MSKITHTKKTKRTPQAIKAAALSLSLLAGSALSPAMAQDNEGGNYVPLTDHDVSQMFDGVGADTDAYQNQTPLSNGASLWDSYPLYAQADTGNNAAIPSPAVTDVPATVSSTDPSATAASAFSLTAPLSVGAVTFGTPWVLLGFLSFPILWRLMRSTPPVPRREGFPAIRLLFNLKAQDQEPAKMPLWQRLLRLALAGTIITAMADPELRPSTEMTGEGAVVIMVDNGWASAPHWDARRTQIEDLIARAEQDGRPVSLVSTARPEDGGALVQTAPVSASDARDVLASIQPQPWPVDRAAALTALEDIQASGALTGSAIFWLSNGLEDDLSQEFGQYLSSLGSLDMFLPEIDAAPYILSESSYEGDILRVDVQRALPVAEGDEPQETILTAYDERGRPIIQSTATFDEGEDRATASFRVPVEIRNEIARIGINGHNHAGATLLMDERWRLRPVGVIETPSDQGAQDLLREDSYVTQALNPHANVMLDNMEDVLNSRDQSVIIMPDAAPASEAQLTELQEWVEQGGTLLRFAGPRMAADLDEGLDDPLRPVELRSGIRVMDENFAGAAPQAVGSFAAQSPFADIQIDPDVRISRQILAQPNAALDSHVWARLADGTPLVTARQIGEGWSVLIHTTSNTDWSDLVLSGMFVDMMRGVVAHSQGLDNGLIAAGAVESPLQSLNTEGRLSTPPVAAQPITSDVVEAAIVSPQHPAGYYGSQTAKFAYNLSAAVDDLRGIDRESLPQGATVQSYDQAFKQDDLKGYLLSAAFMLAITDLGVMLGQRGALPLTGRRRKTRPVTPA